MTEIRESAASSTQVHARLRRLLEHLANTVPPARQPAVAGQLALLEPVDR